MVFKQKMPPKPGLCLSPFHCVFCVHVYTAASIAGTETFWLFFKLDLGIAVLDYKPYQESWRGLSQLADASCSVQVSYCKRSLVHLEELQPLQCRRALRWTVVGDEKCLCLVPSFTKNLGIIKKYFFSLHIFYKEMVWCITAPCHSLWSTDSSSLRSFWCVHTLVYRRGLLFLSVCLEWNLVVSQELQDSSSQCRIRYSGERNEFGF